MSGFKKNEEEEKIKNSRPQHISISLSRHSIIN